METGITEFDTIINLIKEANERNSKCKNKINFQIEEINKTKAIINQFEECLKQQNEMLNKLLDEKFTAKKYKDSLVEELNKLENSDDEECKRSVYDNQDKFIEKKSINIEINNDGHGSTCQDILYNSRQIGYEQDRIDNSTVDVHDDQYKTNFDMLNNCSVEPFKRDLESSAINDNLLFQSDNNEPIENDCFVPYENNDRKVLILQAKIKIPENKTSIFKDEDFIKNYSPKLLYRFKNETKVEMIAERHYLYACCDKGMVLIYHNLEKKWIKMHTGNSKKVLQYGKYNKDHFMFCENEFVRFSELKTEVKEFDSNIISNMRKNRKNRFCYISLENGEIWKYDIFNNKYDKIFTFHSKMKACINLSTNSTVFLTEDGKVFITSYQNFKAIPELDGCVDILTSYLSIVVCSFGNGVCRIYNTANKRMVKMKFSESIKFAKHSRSFLSVLDIQNKLHLYNFKRNAFTYKEGQVIQIPTSKNISAMSSTSKKQIYITVENDIYSIKVK